MVVNGTVILMRYHSGGGIATTAISSFNMSAGEIITGVAIILLGFVIFLFLLCLYISKCGRENVCASCCGGNGDEENPQSSSSNYQHNHHPSTTQNSSYVPELQGLEDLEQYLEDRCLSELPAYIRQTLERPPPVTENMRPGKPVGLGGDPDPPPTYDEAMKVIEEEKRQKKEDDSQPSTSNN